MLQVMFSKRYCLASRDTARESCSLCSRVSSAMRRLYLRACEKTMLSLHLSEWLECENVKVRHSQWVFFIGLWRVCGQFLCGSSCLGRISLGRVFKSKFDCGMEVIHEVFHGLGLFGGAQIDQEDIVYEFLPEGDGPDKGFLDSFLVATNEKVSVCWGGFSTHGCTNELEKMPVRE